LLTTSKDCRQIYLHDRFYTRIGTYLLIECIAEFTGRPLLSLTCGDLGNNEMELERHLSKWFRLAEKWGAVMLLDEADVYLERRLIADLKRNSLVSGTRYLFDY
jgi:hypothetical protein